MTCGEDRQNRAPARECASLFDFYPLSDYTHRSQHSKRDVHILALWLEF
jgi:hypothetical protein